MYRIISVSNRNLTENFLEQIKKISELNIPIILREKDLTEEEYAALARETFKITDNIILHSYIKAARKLGRDKIHLPMHLLKTGDIYGFKTIGASVHSVEEAKEAELLGASYITAGHIFATDCKRGVPPRGPGFLKDVCSSVNIPVYAIGGITPKNAALAIAAGASGVCVMSSLMTAAEPRKLVDEFGLI